MKSVRTMLAALALGLGLASAARAEDIVVTHYASLLYGTPYAVARTLASLDRLSAQGGLRTSTRKVAIEFVAAQ